MKMILIRTERVHVYTNGLVGVELPSVPLAPETTELIASLFPNLKESVYELLDREALFQAAQGVHADFGSDVKHTVHETSDRPLPVKKATKCFDFIEPTDL